MPLNDFVGLVLILVCIYVIIDVSIRIRTNVLLSNPFIIVIEGLDGAGKNTTAKALTSELNKDDLSASLVSFPMYGKWHCKLVELYLNGKFGKDPTNVSPYLASLFYAIDRYFGMKSVMRDARTLGIRYIILDRYVTSNMVYQVSKAKTWRGARRIDRFIQFIEYGLFRLPRPDHVILLTTNAERSVKNMQTREKLDIHETNIQYLMDANKTMLSMAAKYKWYKISVFKKDTHEFREPAIVARDIINIIEKD